MVMIAFIEECLNNYASGTVGCPDSTDPARGLPGRRAKIRKCSLKQVYQTH